MELGQDFSLDYAFHWDLPITAVQQESIAAYGNNEDRIQLAEHFSVKNAAIEAINALPEEQQTAIRGMVLTPVQRLKSRLSHKAA